MDTPCPPPPGGRLNMWPLGLLLYYVLDTLILVSFNFQLITYNYKTNISASIEEMKLEMEKRREEWVTEQIENHVPEKFEVLPYGVGYEVRRHTPLGPFKWNSLWMKGARYTANSFE